MNFINPPPSDNESDSPIYHMNSAITVKWTEGEEGMATSLTLWQLNSTTRAFFGNMKYITNNVLDRNNFRWIVATSKNLAVSNLFFLSIFEEGKTEADANSLHFIIEAEKGDDKDSEDEQNDTSTLIKSTLSTTSATSKTTSTPTSSPGSATTDPTTTDNPSEDSNRTGLSSSGKIAIGTAIPLVVLLAIAGFFLLKWRRKGRREEGQPVTAHGQPYDPKDPEYKTKLEWHYWQSYPPSAEHGQWERMELPGSETRQTTMVYELETPPQQRV